MKFSLINVMKENEDGTVDGYWIQNCIGTLKEAQTRVIDTNTVNGNSLVIKLVDEIRSTTPALGYFKNIKIIV